MWNYSFVFPSMLILLTLLSFYFVRPRLPIRLYRTFLGLMALQLWVMVFDILSSRADENYAQYSTGLLYALNGGFFILFIARIFWFYRFTLGILNITKPSKIEGLSAIPFYVTEAVCLSSFITGAVFSIGDKGYVKGPLYNILYVCFAFYLALSLGLLLSRARHLKRSVLAGGLAYNLVLVLGNVVRFLLPQYLVMDTFCTLAIIIIYLSFLNPDLYLSDRGPAFNMRGFRLALREIRQRPKYAVLGIMLQNYNNERSILGGDQMDVCIMLISQYLSKTFPRCLPFYLRSGRFALTCADAETCERTKAQIMERFHKPWQAKGTELYLNIAFASVDSSANLASVDRIVNNLVLALSSIRSTGESMNIQEIDQQIDITRSLEHAVEGNRVEVFLQPVVRSDDHQLAGAEALARIRDANGQLISPALFIPIAERSGYINQLGEQVFEKTCAFADEENLKTLGLEWLNVNLSPIQCMQRDLSERFSRILSRYNASPEQLHLEITEQSMGDYVHLQQQLKALQERGFKFVLDDFGSGYSNLTRVKHYPFINIKIDMEVVWDYFHERDSLLPTLVQGFHSMGFTITAEGIETPEMAEALTEIGCDYLQGYMFSKPLPMEEFVQKYRKNA